MPLNLSLPQLRYFLAVADCLSYTEAARRLHISQPPLSKQVALLEAELGLLLFRRERWGVTLTLAGAALAEDVRALFAHLDRSVARAQQLAAEPGGKIRLAIPESMVLDPLQALLRDFMDSHPGIQFQISRLNIDRVRESLLSGGADLLFTLSFERESLPGCEFRLLAERKGRWILSREHPLASRRELNPADFPELDLVVVSREICPGGFAWMQEICEAVGFGPRTVIEAPGWDAMLTYVELGRGLAMVGQPLAERNADRFMAFQPGENVPPVGMMLAWRGAEEHPALRAFLDFLAGQRPG